MTSAELRARGQRLFPELDGLGASPLERWKLPEGWPVPEIWVKRDDLLGEGGTKTRKLRVELARAKADGVALTTIGYLDSNHAPSTARLGAQLGVAVRLALLGRPAEDPARAERLRALAPCHFHATTVGLVARTAAQVLFTPRLRLLPPGGTTPRSTAAVALAVAEVVEQFGEAPLPERWAVAVGSGGALAGLWAGVRALGLSVRPYGAATSSRWVGPRRVASLANRALATLGVAERVAAREVEVDFATLGEGHARATPASAAVLSELAARGQTLEPIFTAKAMAGLRARAQPGTRWLFWHTGLTVR